MPRVAPVAGAAASFVYRVFDAHTPVTMPDTARRQALAQAFPDALLFPFPKPRGSMARDFKWLGSYRYGIVHLGGRDAVDLRERCEAASALLGWPAPYADRLGLEPAALPPLLFVRPALGCVVQAVQRRLVRLRVGARPPVAALV